MTYGFSLEWVDSAQHPGLPALRQLLQEYQQGLGISLCFQGFDAELAALPGPYAPPHGRLYLACLGPQPVGCVALRAHDADTAEMKRLYLQPALQGQGFGRIMAERVIADARQMGYKQMLLDTLPMMQSAQALYAKLGFRPTEAYVHNPIEGVRYMALELWGANQAPNSARA
jgi:GNAT superfamily N-acetyltransferase